MAVVYTLEAFDIHPTTAYIKGGFHDSGSAKPIFQWKLGPTGGIKSSKMGWVPPGIYSKYITGLNQNSLYYSRFGIWDYGYQYGYWEPFNTLSVGVKTLPAEIISPELAKGWVDWLEGGYRPSLIWKLGEEGVERRFTPVYDQYPPWFGHMAIDYPNSIYYYKGGIYFESGPYHYEVWGDWVMFHNAPYIYHYRAYAIGSDKLKHFGEDKYFMPRF